MIWPDFCSALIVGRLRRLVCIILGFGPFRCPVAQGLVQTLRVPPRDPPERRQFQVPQILEGLRRQTSSVLYAPSALSAMALSYESPTVPVEGSMPNSPTLVVYTRLMYCAPWYATPHSLQRKPQRMSDHIIPSNADDASADPRSAHVQPLIQPQRATTYTPIAYTRPVYGGSQPCHRPRHLKP